MRPLIAFFLLVAVNLLWMIHTLSGLTPLNTALILVVAGLAAAVYAGVKKLHKPTS